MEKIFISYKRQDKDIVFPIVKEIIQKTGVDCWIDLKGIESGDLFQSVIIDAIDKADIFVFTLSKNFIAPYKDEKTGQINLRKQTFPQKEVMYALSEGKRLIPLSIDGTNVNDCKWLKFNCSGLDCIAWENSDQRNKFLTNLISWTGGHGGTSSGGLEKIKPPYQPSDDVSCGMEYIYKSHQRYATLHFHTDKDCQVIRYGKSIGVVNHDEWKELYLIPGRHELSFISCDNEIIKRIVEIPNTDYTDFINVKFIKKDNITLCKSRSPIVNAGLILQFVAYLTCLGIEIWMCMHYGLAKIFSSMMPTLTICLIMCTVISIASTYCIHLMKKWALPVIGICECLSAYFVCRIAVYAYEYFLHCSRGYYDFWKWGFNELGAYVERNGYALTLFLFFILIVLHFVIIFFVLKTRKNNHTAWSLMNWTFNK